MTCSKKVGILTFHRALNYGALLQAYALQKTLDDLNIDNCLIDYRCPRIEKEYRLSTEYGHRRGVKGKIVFIFLRVPVLLGKRLKFRSFMSRFVRLSSKKGIVRKDLTDNWKSAGCDLFITGSDQVWHYGVTDFDTTYFLDFVPDSRNKLSYAASFGFSDIPQEYLSRYRDLLRNFELITVRERAGAEIFRKQFDRKVPIVLDPTLLVPRQGWHQLGVVRNRAPEYVLLFCIVTTDSIRTFAHELAVMTGTKLIEVNDGFLNSWEPFRKIGTGPLEFISLFIHAKYVVTNSFHGTAFAINLNKKFFVELQSYSNNTNSRIVQLLDLFGLHGRSIAPGDRPEPGPDIDFDEVNHRLETERRKSIDVLRSMLENDR